MCSINLGFTGAVTLYLFMEVFLSFFNQPLGAGCKIDPNFSRWHFASIMWLDLIQSMLMCVLVCFMYYKKSQQNKSGDRPLGSVCSEDFGDDDDKMQTEERFQAQINIITIFYLVSSTADWLYIIFGEHALTKGNMYCLDDKFVITADTEGTVILLFYTIFAYAYASVILVVFYFIPKKSGLVLDLTVSGKSLHLTQHQSLTESMVLQEKEQAALMIALKNETRFTELHSDSNNTGAGYKDQEDVGTADPMFDEMEEFRVNNLINTSEVETNQRKGSWGQKMDSGAKSPLSHQMRRTRPEQQGKKNAFTLETNRASERQVDNSARELYELDEEDD